METKDGNIPSARFQRDYEHAVKNAANDKSSSNGKKTVRRETHKGSKRSARIYTLELRCKVAQNDHPEDRAPNEG